MQTAQYLTISCSVSASLLIRSFRVFTMEVE
jgi:hypothetical protein